MAHTERNYPYNVHRHELTVARKFSRQQGRAKARSLMQQGKFDLVGIRTTKGSEGWISW